MEAWSAIVERLKDPRLLVKIALGSFLVGPAVLAAGMMMAAFQLRPLAMLGLAIYVVATFHALFCGPIWCLWAAARCWQHWRPGLAWLLLTPVGWFANRGLLNAQLI